MEPTPLEEKIFAEVDGDPTDGGFAVRPGHSSVTGFINEEVNKVGLDGRPYKCRRVWANVATGEGLHLHAPAEEHHHVVAPKVEKVLVSEGCNSVDEFFSYDDLPFDVADVPAEDPNGRFTLTEGERIKAKRLNAFSAARQYAYAQRDEFWAKVDARRAKEAGIEVPPKVEPKTETKTIAKENPAPGRRRVMGRS